MAFCLDVYTSIPSNYFGAGGQRSRLAVFILPVALELLVRLTAAIFIAQVLKGLTGAEGGRRRLLEPLSKLFI